MRMVKLQGIGKNTVDLSIRRMRSILLYHKKLDSKFETLYSLTLKQRQIKILRIIFDGGLSFEIDTFLCCLLSRNINSEVGYLDIELACSILPHIYEVIDINHHFLKPIFFQIVGF